MTLDVNQPTDQVLVSEIAKYIKEDREEINSISAGEANASTNLTIAGGITTLVVGASDDLDPANFETIVVTGTGVAGITSITGGMNGQVKIFIFQDSNVSFVDGVKSGGQMYLNHLPALSSFNAANGDILALRNIGGNGTVHGYWKELWRQLAVK